MNIGVKEKSTPIDIPFSQRPRKERKKHDVSKTFMSDKDTGGIKQISLTSPRINIKNKKK